METQTSAPVQPATVKVSEAQKISFLKAAGVQLNSWKALPLAQQQTKLMAWCRTQPIVSLAAFASASNNVYVLFKDNDPTLILNNRPAPSIQVKLRPRAAYGDQPRGTKASLIFSLQANKFTDPTPELKTMLDSQGYNATRYVLPTVEQIKAINGSSVVYWTTHCGLVRETVGGVTLTRYVLDSGEPATDPLSAGAYKTYRANHELLLCGRVLTAPDGTVSTIATYGLTDLFVQHYLSFPDYSLVCLDACTSAFGTMWQAFQKAGVGTYVGWSSPAGTASDQRFSLMLDKLLGTNVQVPKPSPLERAFDMDTVQSWMQQNGFDHDASAGSAAQLQWFKRTGAKCWVLRPCSIRTFYEAPGPTYRAGSWLIEGIYGPDPGAARRTVTWGSTPCNLVTWDEVGGLTVGFKQPYPVGDLVVTKDGRKSISIPITEWDIPLTYTGKGRGSEQLTIKMTLKLRGDVRGNRDLPGQAIQYHQVNVSNFGDSVGTVSATGSYRIDSTTTELWTGSDSLKSIEDGISISHGLEAVGYVDVPAHKIHFQWLDTTGIFQIVTKSGGSSSVSNTPAKPLGFPLGFDVHYDPSTYAIIAGSASAGAPQGGPLTSAKLSWPAVPAINPPTSASER